MVYLQASIKLRPGKQADFVSMLNKLAPVLAKRGMRLLGSYGNLVGRLNTVIDLWEIENPNSVPATLAEASKDAEFKEWAAHLPELLEEEVLQIMTKVPYSP